MLQQLTLLRMRAALLTLESSAARAGCALACPFASSDEFEAAVIRSKRAAGVYGPKRRQRHLLMVGLATAALAILLWMVQPL
jgi:hypothetical protein